MADVHIGSLAARDADGPTLVSLPLNPEEQPGTLDTPVAKYIPADIGRNGQQRLLL
jgi:hypothetical protein